MGIWNRVKNIVSSNTHELLDQLENPTQSLNRSIRDLEKEIEKGQQALATQLFLENKQRALILDAEQVIAKRERQAALAVELQDEQVAKIALQEKILQEKKKTIYQEQFDVIQNHTTQLQEKLVQLSGTLEDWKHKRLLLVSRANVAKSVREISHTIHSFSPEDVAKEFAIVEDRVLFLEARLEAAQRLKSSTNYYVDHAVSGEVEEELNRLKEAKSTNEQ
ncbi:PspA/IM30 family protein [Brevibacillus sp. SYSU BS000544]|uniref:PspA/IM30 family protein n=1 Tax=Brevibacillus sp. SYSU BS000544 TaxID=3416443 RepID=UPI003CE48E04